MASLLSISPELFGKDFINLPKYLETLTDKELKDWRLEPGNEIIGHFLQNELDKRASKLDAECNEKYAENDQSLIKVCRFGYKFEDLNQFEKMCRLRLDAPKTKFKCEGGTRITQNRLEFTVAPKRFIKEFEFKNNRELTHVIIASHIGAIGGYAFQDCKNLMRLDFEQNSNLGYIGRQAFCNCFSDVGNDSNPEVLLPDSCHIIKPNAFANCKKLAKVKLPKYLKTLAYDLFKGCSNLTEVVFPEELEHIRESAFESCEKLTTVKLPKNLRYIGDSAFGGCKKLTTVKLPKKLQILGEGAFYICSNLAEVVFPAKLYKIEMEVFYQCGLQEVIIPDSVETIGKLAFGYCSKLEEINLGKKVYSFRNSFVGCFNLKKIIINNNKLKIEYQGNKKALLKYMGLFRENLLDTIQVVYL